LADGAIDVVATDHCSFSLARKQALGSEDIFRTPGGIPGVETRLPILYSEGVARGRISLQRFVELVAANPARIMGLSPAKGEIAVGADADLTILDPDKRLTLDCGTLHQQVDYTPFAGLAVQGWPETVLIRGQVVVEAGRLRAAPGSGGFVARHIQ